MLNTPPSASVTAFSSSSVPTLIQNAIAKKSFPPELIKPDISEDAPSLFSCPYCVWVPESKYGKESGKPFCLYTDCNCEPVIQQYCSIKVHDVEHDTDLLYVRYKCANNESDDESCYFSTISEEFLQRCERRVVDELPYFISASAKGISFEFLKMIQHSILRPGGIKSVLDHVCSIRQKRFIHLKDMFASSVVQSHLNMYQQQQNGAPDVETFMRNNQCPEEDFVIAMWMKYTAALGRIGQVAMERVVANQSLKIECMRKNYPVCGTPLANAEKTLIIISNEISQWKCCKIISTGDIESVNNVLNTCKQALIREQRLDVLLTMDDIYSPAHVSNDHALNILQDYLLNRTKGEPLDKSLLKENYLDELCAPKTLHEPSGSTTIAANALDDPNANLRCLLEAEMEPRALEHILLVHSLGINIRQGVKNGRFPKSVGMINLWPLCKACLFGKSLSKEEKWLVNILYNDGAELARVNVTAEKDLSHSHTLKGLENGLSFPAATPMGSPTLSDPEQTFSTTVSPGSMTIGQIIQTLLVDSSNDVFNSDEMSLLYSIANEQRSLGTNWRESDVVTMIMYNTLVQNRENVEQKSIEHIHNQLNWLSHNDTSTMLEAGSLVFGALHDENEVETEELSQCEEILADSLFSFLKNIPKAISVGKMKGVTCHFVYLWRFIAAMCKDIRNIHHNKLNRIWEARRKKQSKVARQQAISFVNPEGDPTETGTLDSGDETSTENSNNHGPGGLENYKIPSFTAEQAEFVARRSNLYGKNIPNRWSLVRQDLIDMYGDSFQGITPESLNKRMARYEKRSRQDHSDGHSPNPVWTTASRSSNACESCRKGRVRCDGTKPNCLKGLDGIQALVCDICRKAKVKCDGTRANCMKRVGGLFGPSSNIGMKRKSSSSPMHSNYFSEPRRSSNPCSHCKRARTRCDGSKEGCEKSVFCDIKPDLDSSFVSMHSMKKHPPNAVAIPMENDYRAASIPSTTPRNLSACSPCRKAQVKCDGSRVNCTKPAQPKPLAVDKKVRQKTTVGRCDNCKRRKIRCDGTKPGCSRETSPALPRIFAPTECCDFCKRRNIPCDGTKQGCGKKVRCPPCKRAHSRCDGSRTGCLKKGQPLIPSNLARYSHEDPASSPSTSPPSSSEVGNMTGDHVSHMSRLSSASMGGCLPSFSSVLPTATQNAPHVMSSPSPLRQTETTTNNGQTLVAQSEKSLGLSPDSQYGRFDVVCSSCKSMKTKCDGKQASCIKFQQNENQKTNDEQ